MPIEILMPALSPTMKEGNLATWHKKEGDQVNSGEVIAEIETDKATMEVEAVDEGVIGKIVIAAGTQNVAVNQVIAVLLEEGEDAAILADYKVPEAPAAEEAKAAEPEPAATAAPVPTPAPAPQAIAPAAPVQPVANVAPQTITKTTSNIDNSAVIASPVAKKIAAQNNLDLRQVRGTGPKGRILKEDVLKYLDNPATKDVIIRDAAEVSAIANNNIRQVIARRLVEAKQTIPHFYLALDCDIANLLALRVQVNSSAARDEQGKPVFKISVNDLVIKAVALALKKVPAANASWSDEAVLRYNNVDISVAVAIADGLITPIVANADQKSVKAISNEMKQLVKKAKSGTLKPEEFQGGGFSISNLGMYGIKQFNAIVNPPQGCILAVGSGEKRVIVAEDGSFKATDMMTVTLSCDHRVVDGAVGAEFLSSFKFFIENPATLLL